MARPWWNRLFRDSRRPSATASTRPRWRPQLDLLEDRIAPATRIWDGGGATNLWTDRFNWQGDLAPTANDDLEFGDAAPINKRTAANDFAPGASFNSIKFTAGGYRLAGNLVALGAGGVTYDAPGGGQSIIDLPLDLTGFRPFTVVQDTLVDALLVRGPVSGTGGVDKQGEGFLGLGGAALNTYSGLTRVSNGTLTLHSNSALGSPSVGTEVVSGSTVELNRFGLNFSIGEDLVLNGDGEDGLGALRGTSNSEWTGDIQLASDTRIVGVFASFALEGVISGNAAADLTLEGPLLVTAANNYQGFTTIADGIVTLGNASALGSTAAGTRVLDGATLSLGINNLTVPEPLFLNGDGFGGGAALSAPTSAAPAAVSGDIVIESDTEISANGVRHLTLSGDLSGAGNLTLRKSGGGTLRYANAAGSVVTFTGRTDVENGTLLLNSPNRNVIVGDLVIGRPDGVPGAAVRLFGQIDSLGNQIINSGSNQIADSVTVFVKPGGLLDLNNNSDFIGGLNMTGGTVTTGEGVLRLNGDVTADVITTQARISGRLDLHDAARTFTVADGTTPFDLFIDASIESPILVAHLVKEGAGTLVLAGNNGFNGEVLVNTGSLSVQNNNALGTTVGITRVASGATLRLDAAVSLDEAILLGGAGVDGVGALLHSPLSGPATSTLTNLLFLGSDSTIGVGPGSTLVVRGEVRDTVASGGPTLTKIGQGTLSYAGSTANTFDGTTRVHDGVLLLDRSLINGTIVGPLVIGDGEGDSTAVARHARGNQIADPVAVTINNGAQLDLVDQFEAVGPLTLAGGKILSGPGTLTLLADVTVNSSAEGSLIIGDVSLGFAAAGETLTRTFTVADTTDGFAGLAHFGPIKSSGAGAVNLVKRGSGTLVFASGSPNDANSYTGTTTVLEGTLSLIKAQNNINAVPGTLIIGDDIAPPGTARAVLLNDEQIPDTAVVFVNRSGVFDLDDRNETISQVRLTGGQVETGSGTLSISSLHSSASDVPAVVNGKLALQGASAGFFIADGAAAEDVILNADVSGGQLFKSKGTGTLVLNGSNTLSSMLVREGVVLVNGSQPAPPVTVDTAAAARATLGGDGGSSGAVTVNDGDLAPGEAAGDAGLFTVVNGLTFSSSAGGSRRLVVNLNGSPNPGVNHDQVFVLGPVNLGNGIASLVVNAAKGFTANGGDTYVIVSNDGNDAVVGRFAGLADEAALTINGQAFRIDYQGGDGNDIALIRNTAATIEDVSITPEVGEGGVATFTARLTDPDPTGNWSVTVTWGDGSAPETIHPGLAPFSLTHRYRDDNPSGTSSDVYTVVFSWTDGGDVVRTRTADVTVRNVAPHVDAGGDETLGRGGVLKRQGSFHDPGADSWVAFVDFGDGSGSQRLHLNKDGTFRLQHKYRNPGVYLVTVIVLDDDGDIGTDTFLVTVL